MADLFSPASPEELAEIDQEDADLYAPATKFELMDQEPVSKTESVVRALGQGLTASYHDEAAAGLDAVIGKLGGSDESFGDIYREHRDYYRSRMAKSEEAHPEIWYPLNAIGALFGAGKVTKAGKAIKSAILGKETVKKAPTVLKTAGALAGYGAADATGMSEADISNWNPLKPNLEDWDDNEWEQLYNDALTGSKYALLTGGLMKGGAKTVKGFGKLTNEGVKRVLTAPGVPKKHIDRYLARSKQIEAAKTAEELSEEAINKAEDLFNDVWEGSQKAANQLPENILFDARPIYKTFNEEIQKLAKGTITQESKSAARKIVKLKDNFRKATKTDLTNDAELVNVRDLIPIKKELDTYMKKAWDNKELRALPEHSAKLKLRRSIDGVLKQHEGYKNAMIPVAEDMDLLKKYSQLFSNRQGFSTDKGIASLNRLGNQPQKYPEKMAILNAFDRRMGTNITEGNFDRLTREIFDKDLTRGSRMALVGGSAGASIGGAIGGPQGALIGGSIGTSAGATLGDKYGGQLTRQTMKAYNKTIPLLNKASEYSKLLWDRFTQGGDMSLTATHYLLMQTDERYRKKTEKALNREQSRPED